MNGTAVVVGARVAAATEPDTLLRGTPSMTG
jgi:hypothetical protein